MKVETAVFPYFTLKSLMALLLCAAATSATASCTTSTKSIDDTTAASLTSLTIRSEPVAVVIFEVIDDLSGVEISGSFPAGSSMSAEARAPDDLLVFVSDPLTTRGGSDSGCRQHTTSTLVSTTLLATILFQQMGFCTFQALGLGACLGGASSILQTLAEDCTGTAELIIRLSGSVLNSLQAAYLTTGPAKYKWRPSILPVLQVKGGECANGRFVCNSCGCGCTKTPDCFYEEPRFKTEFENGIHFLSDYCEEKLQSYDRPSTKTATRQGEPSFQVKLGMSSDIVFESIAGMTCFPSSYLASLQAGEDPTKVTQYSPCIVQTCEDKEGEQAYHWEISWSGHRALPPGEKGYIYLKPAYRNPESCPYQGFGGWSVPADRPDQSSYTSPSYGGNSGDSGDLTLTGNCDASCCFSGASCCC